MNGNTKKLNLILTAILIILTAGILLTGGIHSLFNPAKQKDSPQNAGTFLSNQSQFIPRQTPTGTKAFTKIGQLRAATKPDKNGKTRVVIVTPYIEYDDDQSFYEELDRNLKKMQDLTIGYFSSHSPEDLAKKGEAQINSELLEKLNSILVLQKIQRLYFTDYIIL